ncbi:MAG: FG-GAP-like repeat-containing protein [bacterium]
MKKMLLLVFILGVNSLIFGQLLNPTASYDLSLQETNGTTNQLFGETVINAGDVNKDGFNDLFVSAPGYDNNKGRCYLYYGGSAMDNVADKIFTGETMGDNFGCSISAGDFNNDGYADLLIGASNTNSTGAAYLYLGGSDMDVTSDAVFTGLGSGDTFGYSVAFAGDLNGDSCNDIIISAPNVLININVYDINSGSCYIFYGGTTLDNIADVELSGNYSGIYLFGFNVAPAGDVNNDGFADVIISEKLAIMSENCVVFYGGANMDNIVDYEFCGSECEGFGSSISCLGDINNDSKKDIVIGASDFNFSKGFICAFYGDSNVDGVRDLIVEGAEKFSSFGKKATTTCDINNDGYDDIIVGAESDSNFLSFNVKGSCYVYYGGTEIASTPSLSFKDNLLNTYFGCSVVGVDLNNDGYGEVVVGAKNPTGDGVVYIYGLINRISDVENEENLGVKDYLLQQNYPNPFNPSTKISFNLPDAGFVSLAIYNMLGQTVKVLINEDLPQGNHEVVFNSMDLSSGTYIYTLTYNGKQLSNKMMLLK